MPEDLGSTSYLDGCNDAANSDYVNGIDLVDDARYKADYSYKRGVDTKTRGFHMIYMGDWDYFKAQKWAGLRNIVISSTRTHYYRLINEGFEVTTKEIYDEQKRLIEALELLEDEQSKNVEKHEAIISQKTHSRPDSVGD